jgi:hypothetical protein
MLQVAGLDRRLRAVHTSKKNRLAEAGSRGLTLSWLVLERSLCRLLGSLRATKESTKDCV